MIVPVAFVVFAGAGAVARAQLGHATRDQFGTEIATLLVNLSGAFLLGVLTARVSSGDLLTAIGAGGIGAFTTYSTFVAACHDLSDHRGRFAAALYIVVTVVVGIGAAELGLALR